jgi:hypothetical protein
MIDLTNALQTSKLMARIHHTGSARTVVSRYRESAALLEPRSVNPHAIAHKR